MVGEPGSCPREMTACSPIGVNLNYYKGVDAFVPMNGAGKMTGNIVKSLSELGYYSLYCQVRPTSYNDVLPV